MDKQVHTMIASPYPTDMELIACPLYVLMWSQLESDSSCSMEIGQSSSLCMPLRVSTPIPTQRMFGQVVRARPSEA